MAYVKLEKLHNIQNVNIYKYSILYFLKLKKNYNMTKSEIHPTWFTNTKILCEGKPLCSIGSTKSELQIDIWLANHPFYTKSQVLIDSEGRVEKFMKKYNLNTTK